MAVVALGVGALCPPHEPVIEAGLVDGARGDAIALLLVGLGRLVAFVDNGERLVADLGQLLDHLDWRRGRAQSQQG